MTSDLCRFRCGFALATGLGVLALACSSPPEREGSGPAPSAASSGARPSILLVTLDTTRADAVAPEGDASVTPALAALAKRSVRFTQAYATAPMTLPSHASMLTGLYPAGHGLHENGRRLRDEVALAPERLRALGYATAAFVSGYPLQRQFGLARGFDLYDDDFGAGSVERSAAETVERALRQIENGSRAPLFLWVHLYDPHEPYAPPEPYRSRFAADAYLGEIAAMDAGLGPLLEAFERRYSDAGFRILVAADHGEGRGDHGEALHGNLLYQGVSRVPLFLAGSGVAAGERTDPVSLRQVAPTLLSWAGDPVEGALTSPAPGPVLGEAMQPFLQYRWQPQVMAVEGGLKAISAGRIELYDVVADPAEEHDLSGATELPRSLRSALRDYPLPLGGGEAGPPPDDEARKRLASLGYIASEGAPVLRPDAPRPADMTDLFHALDVGSRLFVEERYQEAIPLFESVLARDPGNLMVAVRIAVSESALGRDREALDAFARARRIDPESLDARHYLAMHHLRYGRFERAAPLFEAVLAGQPDKLAALRGLAEIRVRERRPDEAAALYERAARIARDPELDLLPLGQLYMAMGATAGAIDAFERARSLQGPAFAHDLELGVLYLADRRLVQARDALDRVPLDSPDAAMALFKRAQVSVLLGEPDASQRIAAAAARADATTRPLIENERLFRSAGTR